MNMLSMLVLKAQMILNNEEGQDLIEYALLVGFIACTGRFLAPATTYNGRPLDSS